MAGSPNRPKAHNPAATKGNKTIEREAQFDSTAPGPSAVGRSFRIVGRCVVLGFGRSARSTTSIGCSGMPLESAEVAIAAGSNSMDAGGVVASALLPGVTAATAYQG